MEHKESRQHSQGLAANSRTAGGHVRYQHCTSSPLSDALNYAARGWPVLPLEPNGKAPLGLLVPHGCLNATIEEHKVRRWWRSYPDANVGIATGLPGPDVVDVDTKNGTPGEALMARARAAGLLRGIIRIVTTPTGGWHFYFPGTGRNGSAIGPSRALELKARGGYVVAPPSRIGAGEYVERDSAADGLPVDWESIRALLTPPRPLKRRKTGNGNLDQLAAWVRKQREGNRNAGLYWACRAAIDEGADDLRPLIDAAIETGLSQAAAKNTAASAENGARYGD